MSFKITTTFSRVACVLPLLALTGCPQPVNIKQLTLQPIEVDAFWQNQFSQTWECSVPGSGLFLNGLGPEPTGAGEINVGFEDIFNQGAQPLPCNQQQQTIYRGHVRFEVGQFTKVGTAHLTFRTDRSENSTGGSSEIPPNSYATVMGMSTGMINGKQGPIFWPYDNDVTAPACGSLTGCSVDITQQVNQWASGAHPNNGLIFAGPVLDIADNLPSDNNAKLTWYSGFTLTILYDPALNPNAPQ